MRTRRVVTAVATTALAASLLTACSVGDLGLAAIGLDADGRLVGGVKVCHADAASAELSHWGDPAIAEWERSGKGRGTETWRLAAATDGPWSLTAPERSGPGRDLTTALTFRVDSADHGWAASIEVTPEALAAVPRGHVIVEAEGPPDPSGFATTVTRVVAVDDLADQPCR